MSSTPFHIDSRINWAINLSWDIAVNKIANSEISINKEASLQLHYSAILKSVLELIKFKPTERFDIELEKSVFINSRELIIDILIAYTDESGRIKKHSIELKCYKTIASSGKPRGAVDIFMCEVYKDLYYSELYRLNSEADFSTCLILTDYKNFINPKKKTTKNWVYDISLGHKTEKGEYNTPIGGKKVQIFLEKAYEFNWTTYGRYWAVALRPI